MAFEDDVRAQLKKLDFLLGEWSEENENCLTHEKFQTLVTVEKEPHSLWYLMVVRRDGKIGTRVYFGYDPSIKQLVQVILSVDGTLSTLRSKGWEGEKLIWRGDAIMEDKKFLCRETVSKLDDASFQALWEIQIPPPKGNGRWVKWSQEQSRRRH